MVALWCHLWAGQCPIFLTPQLCLQETETGILQVVHAQEVGTAYHFLDVVTAEQQLGCVGKLQQWSKAPGSDLHTYTQNTVENVNDTISNAIVLGTWSVPRLTDSSNDHNQICRLTLGQH